MRYLNTILAAGLLSLSFQAQSAWQLDGEHSQVQYLSTKVFTNAVKIVTENNQFTKLSGKINDKGIAELTIDLDSVATNIPIRDQRMRNVVFETSKFKLAHISTQVPMDEVAKHAAGSTFEVTVPVEMELHGGKKSMLVPMRVTKLASGALDVSNVSPILIKAEDFALQDGLQKLVDIMGLMAIPTTVPVDIALRFNPA